MISTPMTRNATASKVPRKSDSLSNGEVPATATYINGGSRCQDASQMRHSDFTTDVTTIGWKDQTIHVERELYSETITAKILRAAEALLEDDLSATLYPELVAQSGQTEGKYTCRPMDFWTCGFFPGSIYALFERATKYPQSMRHEDSRILLSKVRETLQSLGKRWSDPLLRMSQRTDTHDLGFMIMPHMRQRWELFHETQALQSIHTAALSLHSRFDARVGAIRSWDHLTWQKGVNIRDKQTNFLVIIDSLCNLDLLFYAANHTGCGYLAEAAIAHARTLLRTHLRKEPASRRKGYEGMLYSTCHVVNFLPATGDIKEIRTAQGYSPESTWSRGQAWAILGYIQTYMWTKDNDFLDAACGLAEYFLLRLEDAPTCVEICQQGDKGVDAIKVGRFVPLWDFDAPVYDPKAPLRDVSAGIIAANGMLLLAQTLFSFGNHAQTSRYMESAMKIVSDTLHLSQSQERLRLVSCSSGQVGAAPCEPQHKPFDCILRNSTVTWNEQSLSASADHGLVYADYYLIEFGNKLLRMGYT